MVSLLIISHSAHIAEGVKELADQMVHSQVPIAAAGGAIDGTLGTSVDIITQALNTIRSPDGILALVDLGSAVMSAEMALEMSGERFLISKAPIVEGTLVAAVQASIGASLEQVAAAAECALDAKMLNYKPDDTAPPAPPVTLLETTLTINHPAGLHMRPATLFVRTAAAFSSKLRVCNLDRSSTLIVDAKSMIGIMKLGVSPGHRIHITAEGNDAQEALVALETLIARTFSDIP